MSDITKEEMNRLREMYIDLMYNDSRWLTYDDIQAKENGEFEGYMAESLWSSVFLPMMNSFILGRQSSPEKADKEFLSIEDHKNALRSLMDYMNKVSHILGGEDGQDLISLAEKAILKPATDIDRCVNYEEVNQCDGCVAGQYKTALGMHLNINGSPTMSCQKSKYENIKNK